MLPKKAKAEEPKPDVDMVDLTDDTPAPKTAAKRKTVVDDVREPRSVPQTFRSTSNVFVVYFSPIAPTTVMFLRRQPSRALHHTQDDDFVPDKSPPSAKKAKKTPSKKTPTKKTPAKKEPVKELPKPPGYPKEESELKFSVIQGDQAWGVQRHQGRTPQQGSQDRAQGTERLPRGRHRRRLRRTRQPRARGSRRLRQATRREGHVDGQRKDHLPARGNGLRQVQVQ